MSETDPGTVMRVVAACAARAPGPAPAFDIERLVIPIPGYLPARMVADPAGYFVLHVDRRRARLSLEHHRNDGTLDTVIEGRTAAEVYSPAIEKALLSRLDHAAYLGKELARAATSSGAAARRCSSSTSASSGRHSGLSPSL